MVPNDFEREDELMEEFGEECMDMEEEVDEGKPPQLSPSELQKVEEEAGVVEITRLGHGSHGNANSRRSAARNFADNNQCVRLEV